MKNVGKISCPPNEYVKKLPSWPEGGPKNPWPPHQRLKKTCPPITISAPHDVNYGTCGTILQTVIGIPSQVIFSMSNSRSWVYFFLNEQMYLGKTSKLSMVLIYSYTCILPSRRTEADMRTSTSSDHRAPMPFVIQGSISTAQVHTPRRHKLN